MVIAMKLKSYIKKYVLVIVTAFIFAFDLYLDNNLFIDSFEQSLYAVMKLDKASSSSVLPGAVYTVIAFIIISIILLLPVLDFGKKIKVNIKNKSWQVYPIKNIKTYGIVLLVVSIVCLLQIVKFFPFIRDIVFSDTELFDNYYIDGNDVEIVFPEEKRNLIYIFVESLESSNVSVDNGGLFEESIIPNLEQMALDNINFSNNEKIGGAYLTDGASWTAAALIAQTSGIPLKVTLKDFSVNSTRFDSVVSIGDILANNGYDSYFLLGSDANFGGRRAYFANHNYLIKDYNTAIDDGIIDDDYYEWWGYEDYKLFDYAKKTLTNISQSDRPFNLTMLTADTHFPDGYLDKSCDSRFDDPYSNSFYCLDSMLYEFISWVKEQAFYDNTTIVIVGDHLTMQKSFYDVDDDYRTIYNVFINASVNGNVNYKNRTFTAMDMFPTTIAALGGNIKGNRIGLGTNLFSDMQTIPEIMGINKFNAELSKSSHYYYNYIK